eukprot:2518651-Prymnesium_polylepis.1
MAPLEPPPPAAPPPHAVTRGHGRRAIVGSPPAPAASSAPVARTTPVSGRPRRGSEVERYRRARAAWLAIDESGEGGGVDACAEVLRSIRAETSGAARGAAQAGGVHGAGALCDSPLWTASAPWQG